MYIKSHDVQTMAGLGVPAPLQGKHFFASGSTAQQVSRLPCVFLPVLLSPFYLSPPSLLPMSRTVAATAFVGRVLRVAIFAAATRGA